MRDEEKEKCIGCFHVITEPVCKDCYLRQFKMWLEDGVSNNRFTKDVVIDVKKSFGHESNNESMCVLCGRENVSVCTYCYFSNVRNLLERSGMSEEILEGFLEMFNYYLYNDNEEKGYFGRRYEDVDKIGV
jgi:hypothetical protein